MRRAPSVRTYCAAVFLLGCATFAALGRGSGFDYIADHPVTFAVLMAGIVLGELLPVQIPRRSDNEEIVLSTSFAIALLLAGGFVPAILAQGVASVVQDLIARKPGWATRFNLGQYTLAIAAALLVLKVLGAGGHIGSTHPFTAGQLPAVLAGSAAFFLVNTAIVGGATALHQSVPIVRYFRNDAGFVLAAGSVLLFIAPIVVAAAAYSIVIVPLFAAPILAIHHAGRQSARTQYAARHDALTDLPNRAAFHETLADAIGAADAPFSVLLMDLDRFKEVNDTLGHRWGDLLLRHVAERLLACLGPGEEIARLGGDEFAFFSRRGDAASALAFAEEIVEVLSTPFELEQFVVDAQGSVGVALFPDDGSDVETLLQRADVAMYRAKASHTRVALYDERNDDHSPAKLALTADLRRAVETDEIVVHYQPLLDLATEEITALEALVRWEHPDLGLLPPSAFLAVAEHTNLIKPLTQRVLQKALDQVARWHAAGVDVVVAVNVSARVLVDRGFTGQVAQALREAGVHPGRLKLEVTESTLMVDPESAKAVLADLERLGVALSIDDFGTGYSSLAYLAGLPVSEVKIDRAFVSRMIGDSREAIIVRSTIDLAHHLGLRAVAEGVEDLAVVHELQELGCDLAQGYGVSRPLPADQATRFLLRSRTRSLVDLFSGESA